MSGAGDVADERDAARRGARRKSSGLRAQIALAPRRLHGLRSRIAALPRLTARRSRGAVHAGDRAERDGARLLPFTTRPIARPRSTPIC